MRVLRRGDRIHGGLPFAKGPTTVLLVANVPVECAQSDKTSYGCRRAPASNSASTENKKTTPQNADAKLAPSIFGFESRVLVRGVLVRGSIRIAVVAL